MSANQARQEALTTYENQKPEPRKQYAFIRSMQTSGKFIYGATNHHIVELGGQNAKISGFAGKSRGILRHFGIVINSAENGVALK